MTEDIVSAATAASFLGVHPETVKRLCRDGSLPASKFGKAWLIRSEDLERFSEGYKGNRGRPRVEKSQVDRTVL